MLNAKDLRIGNYIKPYVIGVNSARFVVVTADLLKYAETEIYSFGKSYEGIPLTPEILEKAGWIWNKECNSYEKYPNGDTRMNLSQKQNGSYDMFNYVLRALICQKILFVHQLQNLYFCLCGEELEINL